MRRHVDIPGAAIVAAGLDDEAHPAFEHAARCCCGGFRRGRGFFRRYAGNQTDMLALLYYVESAPPFEPVLETGCDPREHRALHKASSALRRVLGLSPGDSVPVPTSARAGAK